MGRGRVVVAAFVVAFLALGGVGMAQEAVIGGTVKDSTGGVLPGVAVRAVHEATGTNFEAFTDERGVFRVPVRIGTYRIVAELAGFATLERTGLEVLVGQQVTLNLEMKPSSVAETVTVTGEAPLVNVSSSQLGGNIDSRQMEQLPVNGRNFLDLTLLAPGNRANHTDAGGVPVTTGLGSVQLNVDGMQVTNNCCGGSNRQPSFGRDAIAEFQFISNRFDATQGRSSGAQVNVITKSGTNTPSGSLSGYFRHDSLNAADFIQHRVLPYSNQQVSTTAGGPLRRDRLHFFFNYEYEREPSTVTHNTPYPSFNIDLTSTRTQHKPSLRLDSQLSTDTRLTLSSYLWRDFQPIDGTQNTIGGATNHPANGISFDKYAEAAQGTLTRVLGNRAFNETKVGWAANRWRMEPNVAWKNPTGLANARNPVANQREYPPVINLRGFNIGGGTNFPQFIGQDVYTLRDDLTVSADLRGRHDMRVGGEYLKYAMWHDWCNFLRGNLIADNGPVPANIEQLFPVWNDPSTWNLAALSPVSREFRTSFGPCTIDSPRNIFGVWFQDDWHPTSRLTLNLGVRYDVETDTFANELGVDPFLPANRPLDTNNFVPRLGFAYSLNDRTVIRGGGGKYYAWLINQVAHPIRFANTQRVLSALYDGRADFAVNPWNGPLPRAEDLEQAFCNVNFKPGCIRRALGQTIAPPNAETPWAYQASVGVQRQIGDTMGVTVDYSYSGSRRDRVTNYNINLSFDPATGLNYPFTDISRRPYPEWGAVLMDIFEGWSNYHGLETSFTKRMSNRWQASATYSLSAFRDGVPNPWSGVMSPVPFALQSPLAGEYGLAATDQRHRAVLNGIWQMGYGFQLSGLYFFGSGQRFATLYGGDALNTGGTGTSNNPGLGAPAIGARARPANVGGGATPRNGVEGKTIHRVDVRLQKRFALLGRANIDGMLEVFNLFNHANYGSYTTTESNRQYGQPSFNPNVAYQARMAQLGLRFAF
ncbi:MAG: TonB-dependent receptor [Acidobacteria bacterium]|nr:TonB-dependent receptor [Acidobacteriota bacterium]